MTIMMKKVKIKKIFRGITVTVLRMTNNNLKKVTNN